MVKKIISFIVFIVLVGCTKNPPVIGEADDPMSDADQQSEVKPLPVDDNTNHFYYYADGERVQLTPSLDWVSVQFASNDPVEQSVVLENYEHLVGPLELARQVSNPSITILPLVGMHNIRSLVQSIDSLRADRLGFLQVNPVFQENNTMMLITDEFIATFPAGKSLEEINVINLSYGVEIVDPILGQENTFVLRVLPTTMVDALEMANLYQEAGIAIHAAPNFVRIIDK